MYRLLLLPLAALVWAAATPAMAQAPPAEPPALEAHRVQAQRLLRAFPAGPSEARRAANTYLLDTRTEFGMAGFGGELQASTQTRYAYDGTVLTTETRYNAQDGGWEVSGRTVYEYSTPLLVRETEEVWDAEASAFFPESRTIYTYAGSQGSGLPTTITYEAWTGSEWVFVERELYTVAGTGLSGYYSTAEFQVWEDEGEGGAWVPEERFFVVQDGPDVVFTYEVWNGTGWENDERARYHAITTAELWALSRQLEDRLEQYPGLFFAADFPDYTAEEWDGSAWVPTFRSTTTVEYASGTSTIVSVTNLNEGWDEMEEAWLPEFRSVTEYEPAGASSRPVRTVTQTYDEEEEEWVGFFEYVYTYDPVSGRIASATSQLSFMGTTMVLSRTEFTWRPAGGVSTEDGAGTLALRLEAPFPNPATDVVRVTYHVATPGPVALRVYDLLGREVATLAEGDLPAGEHHAAFGAGSLPSGRYVVRLETASGHESRALTVAR